MNGPYKLKYNNSAFPFKKDKPKIKPFAELKKGGEISKEGFSALGSIKASYPLSKGSLYAQGTVISKHGTKGLGSSENIKALELGYQTKLGSKLSFQLGKASGTEVDKHVGDIKWEGTWKPKLKFKSYIPSWKPFSKKKKRK